MRKFIPIQFQKYPDPDLELSELLDLELLVADPKFCVHHTDAGWKLISQEDLER
jgi:hypothetical protein